MAFDAGILWQTIRDPLRAVGEGGKRVVSICLLGILFGWKVEPRKGCYLITGIGQRITNRIFDETSPK